MQVPGQPRGYLIDPPGRYPGAEQAVDDLGGALLAQLPEGVAQQRRGRQVRPVAHRPAHRALRRIRLSHRPAPAPPRDQQVLSDQSPDLGDVDDLQHLRRGLRRPGQIRPAAPARIRLHHQGRVRGARERKAAAPMAALAAAPLLLPPRALRRLALAPLPLRPAPVRPRTRPVRGRRLGGVLRIPARLRDQIRNQQVKRLDLRVLRHGPLLQRLDHSVLRHIAIPVLPDQRGLTPDPR